MRRRELITLMLIIFFYQFSFGQDSSKVFFQENLFWYLAKYHPISKQATIQVEKGKNEVKKNRGVFDPSVFLNLSQKQFNQKQYYSLFSGGLKVPTWYGVDFKAGYENNQGVYLNPETQSLTNGLMYAGVSVPLGKGLIIDKRRMAVKKAKLYAESTYMEQELILNTLFYEASISYIQWANYFNQLQLFQNAYDLANTRYLGVKQSYLGGAVPAIDTLEAYIKVQIRDANLNQANLNYQNAKLELSNFLWFENNMPLEISDELVPPPIHQLFGDKRITSDSLNIILSNLKVEHPQLIWYDFKIKQLEVERKWNVEQLKPKLNVKYNLLNEPVGEDVFTGFSSNNYKWGVDFGIPLLLRESRGKLNLTKLKIQETKYDVDVKWLELTNKIKRYYNYIIALDQQMELYRQATSNYLNLLEAEQQKFSMGESSIFLMNTREANYIQAAIKLIEINVKYQSSIAEFKLASSTWF